MAIREARWDTPVPRLPAALSVRWTWRTTVFAVTLLLYLALIVAIVVGTPLDHLDKALSVEDFHARWPRWHHFVLDYVMLGQRGPSTMAVLPWIAWISWRRRSWHPPVLLLSALVVLNVSVGAVKLTTGRWGPIKTKLAHDVLAGGNIFPSGHTANAVVLYGVLAMLAIRYRRTMIAAAVWISLTVGLSTVYLETHWFTDVVGGWLAGALVLMVLPRTVPVVETGLAGAVGRVRRLRRRPDSPPEAAEPEPAEPEPAEPGPADVRRAAPRSLAASGRRRTRSRSRRYVTR